MCSGTISSETLTAEEVAMGPAKVEFIRGRILVALAGSIGLKVAEIAAVGRVDSFDVMVCLSRLEAEGKVRRSGLWRWALT